MDGPHRALSTSARSRLLALLLAVLGHGAILLLLLLATRHGRDAPTTSPVLVYVQPITLAQPVASQPLRPLPGKRMASARRIQPPARITLPAEPPPLQPSTAIQLPSPDWQLELQRAARNIVERQAEADTRRRSLDARPKALELPKVSTDPRPGDVTLLPNGDRLITFGNGWTCTLSQPALDEAFSVWARFRPQKCTKKGGDAPGGKIELRRRDYLQGPPPEPPQAD